MSKDETAIGRDDLLVDTMPPAATDPSQRDPMDYRVVRELRLQLATQSIPPFQLQWPIPVELDVEWIDDDSAE